MNGRRRFTNALAFGVVVLAVVFGVLRTRSVRADEETRRLVNVLPSAGIVNGETFRVNYLNVGSNPFEIIPCVFDRDGTHIKTGAVITLSPGQTRTFDLSYAETGGVRGASVQVRAAAHVADSDIKSLAVSAEVFDDTTGKSTLFVPGALQSPEPIHVEDESSFPSEVMKSIASVGITTGQTLRVSFSNAGGSPVEIIPCVFDGEGAHLKMGAPLLLASGQTVSFEMRHSEAPMPSASRLIVRGAAHVRNADARSLLISGEVVEDSSGKSALFLPGAASAPEYTRQANGRL